MNKLGGGGLLLAGIVLMFLGFLIKSNLLEWLLEIMGWIVILGGAGLGIVGLIKMFSGDRGRASDY